MSERDGRAVLQQSDEDSYECEDCGAVFNTVLPRHLLPLCCWKCSTRNPWQRRATAGVR